MNFLDCSVKEEGGQIYLVHGDMHYLMPENKAKALKEGNYIGKTVTFGIRPDDIDDYPEFVEKHPNYIIKAECTGYELLGSEVLLYYTANGVSMTAKVDASTPAKRGERLNWHLISTKAISLIKRQSRSSLTNQKNPREYLLYISKNDNKDRAERLPGLFKSRNWRNTHEQSDIYRKTSGHNGRDERDFSYGLFPVFRRRVSGGVDKRRGYSGTWGKW